MAGTHQNPQKLEDTVQYVFILSVIILILLCWFYGVNFIPSLYQKQVFYFLKRAVYPAKRELLIKIMLVGTVFGYMLTRQLRKKENMNPAVSIFMPLTIGLSLMFSPIFIIQYTGYPAQLKSLIYITFSIIGYALTMHGASNLGRIVSFKSKLSQFDKENKAFPMETRKIESPFSVNIKGEKSWINITNPFSCVTVLGVPGTGKTFVYALEFIIQLMKKGFTMCIYDFKEGELSTFAWNVYNEHYKEIKKLIPNIEFNVFNPKDPICSVRLNPIKPEIMPTIEHCMDAATTFYYNLIPGAADKRGDIFFPESGRAYICSLFIFLRFSKLNSKKNADGVATMGNCCTLAHVIALGAYMNDATGKGQDEFYNILMTKEETSPIFKSAFGDAIESKSDKQLSGQIASGKLPLSFLNSPNLFWCLSGDDVSLDVNNPDRPQILSLCNAGEMLAEMYSPILGLIVGQVMKNVNTRHRLPCLLQVDEAYTIYLRDIDKLVATARSNKVATMLIMQDYEMLAAKYKKEQADIIKNISGTKIAGRVNGSSAEYFEKLIGKSLHDRTSSTISKNDVTHNKSQQLEFLVPSWEMTNLNNKEFVGIIADDISTKNPLSHRRFRDVPIIDLEQREKYNKIKKLPEYVVGITREELDIQITKNFKQINQEIKELLAQEHNSRQNGIL